MKPKSNIKSAPARDQCQTPSYALDPLLPYLSKGKVIIESAAGEGNLVKGLRFHGFPVCAYDLLNGNDFFEYQSRHKDIEVQVTNPPFSLKYKWLKHSYEIGIPFALLMPVEVEGAAQAQKLFEHYGVGIIHLSRRINFKMPSHKNWTEATWPTPIFDDNGNPVWARDRFGVTKRDKKENRIQKKTSGAQFPVAWYTWKLDVPDNVWNAPIEYHLQDWELFNV